MSIDDPVVGKLGTVTHEIAPGKPGEIVVHIRGGTETFMATSDGVLAPHTQVLVVGLVTARTVEVTPFLG
jgi:hypothetical protein